MKVKKFFAKIRDGITYPFLRIRVAKWDKKFKKFIQEQFSTPQEEAAERFTQWYEAHKNDIENRDDKDKIPDYSCWNY